MVDRFQRFLYFISEISRHWHKIAADEMEKHGLKGPHATYLICIYRHPEGITAPQITERCGKDKSDVSRTMALMEKKGIVSPPEGQKPRTVLISAAEWHEMCMRAEDDAPTEE